MFYNEPWKNASTEPFPGLSPTEPEVHVHCLQSLPSEEQVLESGAMGGFAAAFGARYSSWIALTAALVHIIN
jgi:hypothetical protein